MSVSSQLVVSTSLRPSRSNLGPCEHVSLPTLCQSVKKDLVNLRRWEGRSYFLFQRVSVLVQRYNAVLLHDTLPAPDCTHGLIICTQFYIILILNSLGNMSIEGKNNNNNNNTKLYSARGVVQNVKFLI